MFAQAQPFTPVPTLRRASAFAVYDSAKHAPAISGSTITEFRPLIYGLLFAESERRKARKAQGVRSTWWVLPAAYVLLMVLIASGSGYSLGEPQFWVMFVPVFFGVELAVWELTRNR